MRAAIVTVVTLALAAGAPSAQVRAEEDAPASTVPAAVATTAAAEEPDAGEHAWAFSAAAYTYFVPNSHEYVQPTFTADRDWLHLEARYNYEDQKTASAWLGYNFGGGGGEELSWEVTPMIGGVFGDTTGVAPGYKGFVSWHRLELYSEGEYVFDTDDVSDSFFYNWSELTFAPLEWFRFGIVAQRTRAYQSDRDIQRGVLVGLKYKRLDLSGYVFNPDDDQCVFVLGLKFDF